jgi:hypothetical protein
MSFSEEISQAISAHGRWKQKLRTAIEEGECESTPEKVSKDNNCSFGKWLHERINPEAKNSPYYTEIVYLHAEFHKEAGAILKFALAGDKEEAEIRIKLGSKFSKTSSLLTSKMKEWQESL